MQKRDLMVLQSKIAWSINEWSRIYGGFYSELYTERKEKEVWERDGDDHRKRKRILNTEENNSMLMVLDNGGYLICIIKHDSEDTFSLYSKKWPWALTRKDIPEIQGNSEDICHYVERILLSRYIKKYGETRSPYSSSSNRRKFKNLSVAEICDWYEQFRKLDMDFDDMINIQNAKKEMERENLSYSDVKKALRIDKTIRKEYDIK